MASWCDAHYKAILKEGENQATTRLIGYELEIQRDDQRKNQWLKDAQEAEIIAGWGYDGADIEVVTNPFSLSQLTDSEVLKKITKLLTDHNCSTHEAGGTHINISKLETDPEYTFQNLIRLQLAFDDIFKKVFGRTSHWAGGPARALARNNKEKWGYKPNRFENGQYSKLLLEMFILNDKKTTEEFSKVNNKNLMVVNKTNRYEFRGGKCSMNLEELKAWGQFAKNTVLLATSTQEMSKIRVKDLLRGDYIENYFNEVVQKNPERALTEKDLTRTAQTIGPQLITENKVF